MRSTTLALAATLAFMGAAFAQTTTAPGSTESNMNNPGSVKSNAEKGLPERGAPAATGTVTAPTTGAAPAAPGASTTAPTGTAGSSAPSR
jgi:hypothetical protein